MLRRASILVSLPLSAALLGAATCAWGAQASPTPKPSPKAPVVKASPAQAAQAARPSPAVFSRWIEDLPVMPGLTETDGGYSFEIAQGGRLAEARLHGVVSEEVVRSFYASTLPSLGWTAEASQPFLYRRGRERLIFHVSPAKPLGVLAVFVLSPRAAAAGPPPAS